MERVMTIEQENSGSEQDTAQASETERVFAKPTKRAKIMRGIVTPIFGLLAVACIVLGVLNATEWKPSTSVTASASVSGSRYIVTDPGVLPLVDKQTKLTVSTTGSSVDVCIAVGSAKDVAGWIAGESYTRITGLADWTTLSTDKARAQGSADTSENPVAMEDSDMWISARCGTREVSLNVDEQDLGPTETNVALIDLGAKKNADIAMHWTRTTVPDFAMPFYLCAVLLAIMAVLSASVFAMPPQKRRHHSTVEGAEAVGETVEEVAVGAPSPWATAVLNAIPSAASTSSSQRPRRRHASHRAGAHTAESVDTAGSAAGGQPATPSIVDPSTRNLVIEHTADSAAGSGSADSATNGANSADTESSSANAANGGADNHDSFEDVGETTSVITPDELQAYFARLAQEAAEQEAANAQSQSDNNESAHSEDDKEA